MKKAFNLFKIMLLTFVVFFIGNNGINSFQAKTKVINDNLDKKVSVNVILNKQKALAMKFEEEKINTPVSTFTGHLTGYSADCAGCSGNLACTGTNVKTNGVFYNDKTYGKVRIVATSSKYPCGTVLRFNLPSVSSEPITAIALDKGVSGNTVDLLAVSSSYARNYIGRINNKKFEVLRLGW